MQELVISWVDLADPAGMSLIRAPLQIKALVPKIYSQENHLGRFALLSEAIVTSFVFQFPILVAH